VVNQKKERATLKQLSQKFTIDLSSYGLGELLLLPFLFAFELALPLIGATPAVF